MAIKDDVDQKPMRMRFDYDEKDAEWNDELELESDYEKEIYRNDGNNNLVIVEDKTIGITCKVDFSIDVLAVSAIMSDRNVQKIEGNVYCKLYNSFCYISCKVYYRPNFSIETKHLHTFGIHLYLFQIWVYDFFKNYQLTMN